MAQFDAVEWMAAHNHPEYANMIHACKCTASEIIGDAGRYWQFCPITQEALKKIDAEIEDIRDRAYDRWYDWATD
jgi:hypothetical protein